jgi:hypothetical protein
MNNSTQLIEILLKTIDKMGIKRTIQVLEISHNGFDGQESLVKLIIGNTCLEFGITEKTLMQGRKNSPNRTDAVGVVSVLLLRMCNLTQRQVALLLKKDPTLINKYIKKFESLDSNFKEDAKVMDKMENIRTITLTQYENNNLDNG